MAISWKEVNKIWEGTSHEAHLIGFALGVKGLADTSEIALEGDDLVSEITSRLRDTAYYTVQEVGS